MYSIPVWRGPAGGLEPEDRVRVDAAITTAETINARIGEATAARDSAVAAAEATDADAQATEAGRQQAVQAAGDAAAAREAAEAARLLAEQERQAAEAAAVAAALRAGYYDTIAAGRAAVADGEPFAVRAGGTDGLARPTIYRRDSATTQTAMVTIVNPSEVDAEVSARRSVIVPDTISYLHEFVARSLSNPRLRYLLGGFREIDGAFEATKLVARNLSGGALSSRWVDKILSSRGDMTLMAWDARGRVRMQPDEATLQFVADNLPPVEGVATDYPLVTTASAAFYRPMGPIIGIHAYGQSWESRNGHDGLPLNAANGYPLAGARFPRGVLTLNDGRGFLGWAEQSASRTDATDYIAGQETDSDVQTPVGAMAFHMGKVASDEGRLQVILARTEARGNQPIETLMPSGMAGATGDGSIYAAWEGAIRNAHAIAQSLGLTYVVRFIPWTHGHSNIDDSYAVYHDKVTRLFNHMSARAVEITGQSMSPEFLVVQQPSSQIKGYSDTFKVAVDLCRERRDCTLVAAGYGHDMIDTVHWNRWAAAEIGELRAITAEMRLRGLPWDAPMLANPRRSGRVITFDVTGAHDVVADETIVSDRHYINGTYDSATGAYTGGTPVPLYGFEASVNGAGVTIESVTVERRKITVTLASDPAPGTLQIRYAMHNNGTVNSSRPDGRSANRGNIRADWEAQSLLNPSRTLRVWMASDYFNISI